MGAVEVGRLVGLLGGESRSGSSQGSRSWREAVGGGAGGAGGASGACGGFFLCSVYCKNTNFAKM